MLPIGLFLPSLMPALGIVPEPQGPYGVSLTNLELVDASRPDPYSGALERRIPISLIIPTGPTDECRPVQQKYLPKATADFWTQLIDSSYGSQLENALTDTMLSLCEPTSIQEQYPLIFFSPGLGAPRQFYDVTASNIAAQGYVVVNIDVPGQSSIVTYLDGSVQYGVNISTDEELDFGVGVRVQDAIFVLDSLTSQSICPWRQPCNLNTSSVTFFGHSFGGDTALNAIVTDKRFIGGVNLDGAIHGAGLNHTTKRPFMIFESNDPLYPHNQSTLPSWQIAWQNLQGPKWQLQLQNSVHNTFTDLPTIVKLWGLNNVPGIDQVLGSIPAREALDVVVSVLSTLASYVSGRQPVQSVLDVATTFRAVIVENATGTGT